jgi:hypothetical protein
MSSSRMMISILMSLAAIGPVNASLNVSESLNSHSFSSLMRSKWAFDAWDARIRAPRDLEQPRRVLSYGCSVGFELLVLAERYPDAVIVGTDQKFSPHSSLPDASAVYGEARTLTAHHPRIKLVPPAELVQRLSQRCRRCKMRDDRSSIDRLHRCLRTSGHMCTTRCPNATRPANKCCSEVSDRSAVVAISKTTPTQQRLQKKHYQHQQQQRRTSRRTSRLTRPRRRRRSSRCNANDRRR